MPERWILFLVLGWWIGWVGCQHGRARDPLVRRALPFDNEPSAEPTPRANSWSTTNNLPAVAGVGIAQTPPSLGAFPVYPASAPVTVANSAIMIDAKAGAVVFFKNPDIPRPVASTQKLLTALLIADHGGLDNSVRVAPEDCAVEPTKLGIRPGEVYTKRQLLAAMLVHSCNDAAVCLARNDAGDVASFAKLMNAKAAQLGAENSHFINPNGLPRLGQFSTARDMARIAFAAYHNSTLREFMRLPGLTFTYSSGRRRFLEPTNHLVTRSPIFNGMKTGYTEMSGRCLVSSASLGGKDIILVQLGGTHRMLFDDAQRLLLWGLGQPSGAPLSNIYSKSSYPADAIGQMSWPESR
ncbi:MAG: D-alanyl-D-alanine carboxypeptidase [Verrucomicrobia bacterium]|nr:D-alanyl-D-alanine carboxypeptidase [Verrucomicrobiota bacterium]MBV8377762.1 D-alanyl-D-alanine carboxypeptidase [Verrucomicrobiota bacterium]